MPNYGVRRDTGQVSQPMAARHRRSRRGPGVVVAALVVGVLIVAALLVFSGHHGQKNTPGTGVLATIPIQSVTVWVEPPQKLPDDPGAASYTFDHNNNTEWKSDIYNGPAFVGENDQSLGGEGLAIHVSSASALQQLRVTSYTPGWAASTYVADSMAPRLAGWGTPTATQSSIAGSTTFALGGHQGSWILLWMTNLGPTDQIGINELAVN